MDHVLTLVSSTFPGADRIEIASRLPATAGQSFTPWSALPPGTARYDGLCEATHPRLRVLAGIGMSALTDEKETVESLQARYEGGIAVLLAATASLGIRYRKVARKRVPCTGVGQKRSRV